MKRPSRQQQATYALLAAGAATACAAWHVIAAVANRHWYGGLVKPMFAPSPWLATTSLVVVVGCWARAWYRMACRPDYLPDRTAALRFALVSLVASAAWAWAFFVGRHPNLSLALAVVLVAIAAVSVRRAASVDHRAALLLLPWAAATILVALVDLSVRLTNG